MKKAASAWLVGVLLFTGITAAHATAPIHEIEHLLRVGDLHIEDTKILAQEILLEAYRENGFRPYWTDENNIRELLRLIDNARDHGLDPDDYNSIAIRRILSPRAAKRGDSIQAKTEILLTESLLRYGFHRRLGKVKASTLDPDINFRRDAFSHQSPGETLTEALNAPSLKAFIDKVAPAGPVYTVLQSWLARYRDIAESGGWPGVPEGPVLRRADLGPRVAAVRARLAVTGELPATADKAFNEFDAELEQAVKTFQDYHGLVSDGIVGRQTLAAMNVSVEKRIDQLRLSLERLRWINQEAANTLVAVNIAGFRAFFIRDGKQVWDTRVMVGRSYRQTPVLRGDIVYMEFNPTWTIPPTILRNDTLPAIKRDPGYLASKNIRVIDQNGNFIDPATVDWSRYSTGIPYTLRQDPGPDNALGTVKFIFPNEQLVYLHDTPNPELFDRAERAFSSGCIRIEDPLTLAELLLDDPVRYPRSALEAVVASGKTQRISLDEHIPVIIVYLTVSVDEDGGILFYRDIYDRDQKLLEALNGPAMIDPP